VAVYRTTNDNNKICFVLLCTIHVLIIPDNHQVVIHEYVRYVFIELSS
jgi:hypothetical protein